MNVRSFRVHIVLLLGSLAGCAALPASGPTEREVLAAGQSANNPNGFHIIPLNASTVAAIGVQTPAPMAMLAQAPPVEGEIGVGDILSISIFEAGNSLFGTSSQASASAAGPSGAATSINLPPEQVDAQGDVDVPYAGRIQAAGATPDELSKRIADALAGQSQNPQVIVGIEKNLSESVIVSGAVHDPGRFPLTLAHEQLLDMVAIAGGPTHDGQDISVQLIRGGSTATIPLDELQDNVSQNIYLEPGDHVQLLYAPRSFTVFGAAQRVQQLGFPTPRVSLADALAQSGGPADGQADPNGIFLFRFESADVAARLGIASNGATVPIIYQLDMMQPESYFAAQQFAMRDQDLLYIANARSDQIAKFFGLIASLVSPASTVNNFR